MSGRGQETLLTPGRDPRMALERAGRTRPWWRCTDPVLFPLGPYSSTRQESPLGRLVLGLGTSESTSRLVGAHTGAVVANRGPRGPTRGGFTPQDQTSGNTCHLRVPSFLPSTLCGHPCPHTVHIRTPGVSSSRTSTHEARCKTFRTSGPHDSP